MNKIYDKLLLVIAVILLAGGVMLYVQKSGEAPEKGQPIDTTPADNPYQAQPVLGFEGTDASWPEPTENSNGWLYYIFTPPEIYIDENGKFSIVPVTPPPPEPEFGVYLESLARKPYRLQIEGYFEDDPKDASKSLLLFYNEETEKQVRARPGAEKPDAEFKFVSFEIERIREGTNIQKIATAVILDQRTGEEVTLVHGERLFEEEVTVVIRSKEDSSFEIVLTEAPKDFAGPIGQYTLKEINLEESSVTVEKHATEDFESKTREFKASVVNTSVPEESTTVEVQDEEPDEILESIF